MDFVKKGPIYYTTADEILFLNGLGTYTENAPSFPEQVPAPVRLGLLRSYVKSMELRSKWGTIDPISVRKHAEGMIERLELEMS